jgi:hypothetical protein
VQHTPEILCAESCPTPPELIDALFAKCASSVPDHTLLDSGWVEYCCWLVCRGTHLQSPWEQRGVRGSGSPAIGRLQVAARSVLEVVSEAMQVASKAIDLQRSSGVTIAHLSDALVHLRS